MNRAFLQAAAVLTALPLAHASAQTYRFKSILFSDAYESSMTDINAHGDMTGGYFVSPSDFRNCFVRMAKTGRAKIALKDPNDAGGTTCWGINDSGVIVGYYVNSQGTNVGFVYSNGTFTDVAPPGAILTYVYGISNSGIIYGTYVVASDPGGVGNGFTFDGTTYTTFKVPGQGSTIWGVNTSGDFTAAIGGKAYLYSANGVITQLVFPGSTSTTARHINDKGVVALNWTASDGSIHGGLYDSVKGTYSAVPYPLGGTLEYAFSVNIHGVVVGRYQFASGVSAGFRASPTK